MSIPEESVAGMDTALPDYGALPPRRISTGRRASDGESVPSGLSRCVTSPPSRDDGIVNRKGDPMFKLSRSYSGLESPRSPVGEEPAHGSPRRGDPMMHMPISPKSPLGAGAGPPVVARDVPFPGVASASPLSPGSPLSPANQLSPRIPLYNVSPRGSPKKAPSVEKLKPTFGRSYTMPVERGADRAPDGNGAMDTYNTSGQPQRRAATPDPETKVIIITGGGQGIGKATAKRFAKEGWKIAVVDRDGRSAEETAAELSHMGADVLSLRVDVGNAREVEAMVLDVVDAFGRVDACFNNAGVEGERASMAEANEEEYDAVMRTNAKVGGSRRGDSCWHADLRIACCDMGGGDRFYRKSF
eukprot:jgi/Mesvir1/17852/Mv12936-RA.1